ncbi:hypothetical protein HN419_00655 [Candidatus Woesearchaeota archaeon]|jgi:sugar-specific transcriptional regulator TrmB|nr:hypothetical protein [Candidatus Woesearchaeota archaeon]MBT3537493.1 hypothetical protein [Candidatus Woesearchaeota archaeon]MBT4697238.1 hypothetical protein [Candidatus Woesearchaeota archaeon]MBT4717618.1 hypothetical protein [Candidatus Woesearchaeota archaeon]MBT7106197.1 hypothetical protein [Candidatus Woesearchaeota archaeon]
MNTGFLKEIGLSDGEAIIYIALLKNGSCSVSRLAEFSGQHRTHIYDTLEKLKEKGLVSYVKKSNKKYFQASDPESLLGYIDEKRKRIEDNIDELKKLKEISREKTQVEVYKGTEGMKNLYRDIIKTGEEVCLFGSGGQLREKMPVFAKQYFRDVKKHGINHKIMFTLGTEPTESSEYKYLSKEYKSPLVTYSYGDKAILSIWGEELIGVLIDNKEFAQGFRQQFDLLWNQNSRLFTGKEGFVYAIFEVLEGGGKEVLNMGYDTRLRKQYGAEVGDKWQSERVRKGLSFLSINNDSKANREYCKGRSQEFYFQYRFLPPYVCGPATYFICGTKMSVTYYSSQELKTLLVEDEEVVKQHIQHFKDSWKHASE